MKQSGYRMGGLPCGQKQAKSIYFRRFIMTHFSKVSSQELGAVYTNLMTLIFFDI
jgi:hypothetical protein